MKYRTRTQRKDRVHAINNPLNRSHHYEFAANFTALSKRFVSDHFLFNRLFTVFLNFGKPAETFKDHRYGQCRLIDGWRSGESEHISNWKFLK